MGIERIYPGAANCWSAFFDTEAEIAALDAMIDCMDRFASNQAKSLLWTKYYCPEMGENIYDLTGLLES